VAFTVAFGMGANNVSRVIGPSVGSAAISLRVGLIVSVIVEFLGTVLMGGMVSGTLKSSIISPIHFEGNMDNFAIGMFATMVTAVVWILVATHYALPISATQTIIGGIVGFAVVDQKYYYLNTQTIGIILLSWFLSPLVGAMLAYAVYYSIYKLALEKGEYSRIVVPAYYGITFTILFGFILHANKHTLALSQNLLVVSLVVIFVVTVLTMSWLRSNGISHLQSSIVSPGTHKEDPESIEPGRESRKETSLNGTGKNSYVRTPSQSNPPSPKKNHKEKSLETQKESNETPFKFLMVVSAAFVAFAHGSNDVSNAAGPYAAIVELHQTGTILPGGSVPSSVVVGCGVGIVLGLFILGYKTLETVGEKITKLTFTKGYSAQLSGAFTILLASTFSLPISTTAILVGGIVGVGLVGDDSGAAIDKVVLFRIVRGWIVTVLVGLIGTHIIYGLCKLISYGF